MKTRIYATVNQNVVRDMFPRYNQLFKFVQFLQYFEIGAISECWEWKGCGNKDRSYGRFVWPEKRIRLAHVASYVFFKGNIPKRAGKNRLCVCHSCDNQLCVNPNHLWLGTYRDNLHDAMKKGRADSVTWHKKEHRPEPMRGEDNPSSKLTAETVSTIRAQYATGKYSQGVLADKYLVNQTLISAIIRNRIWSPLTNAVQ